MTTLPPNRHISVARYFLDKPPREFAAGDQLNGAELLRGAAARALIAVALADGWPCNSHGALRNVASNWLRGIRGRSGFPILTRRKASITHFYHGRLTDRAIVADRPKVARFVNRLLNLSAAQ